MQLTKTKICGSTHSGVSYINMALGNNWRRPDGAIMTAIMETIFPSRAPCRLHVKTHYIKRLEEWLYKSTWLLQWTVSRCGLMEEWESGRSQRSHSRRDQKSSGSRFIYLQLWCEVLIAVLFLCWPPVSEYDQHCWQSLRHSFPSLQKMWNASLPVSEDLSSKCFHEEAVIISQ